MSSSKQSAKTTIKNTSLVGVSQLFSMIMSIVKTKTIAILLGPSGVGMIQLFNSTISLVKSISGLGLSFSGVRDVSESIGAGDKKKISETILTLKRWSWFTGFLGVLITTLFSKQLSNWAFNSEDYWLEISILSLTIILGSVSGSYATIIRGARRMGDYVRVSLWSSILTTILAIIIYYFFKEKGIVTVLIITALIPLIVNIIYSKKVHVIKSYISYKESFYKGFSMVKLGVFTVVTGFISQLSLYYTRVSISDNLGLDSVGYYSVATTLALTYMGLIFNAMSADYFPKVSAINKNDKAINKAILEQTKVLLLLGTPLIIVMFTFSQFIITILYSNEFIKAKSLLMWMLLSVFFKFITFPIGYVFLAKGKSKIFIITESSWNLLFLFLVLVSWEVFNNLEGVGIAYVIAAFFTTIIYLGYIRKLTKFNYDSVCKKYILVFLVVIILYFLSSYFYNNITNTLLKIIVFFVILFFCYKEVEKLLGVSIIKMIKSRISRRK